MPTFTTYVEDTSPLLSYTGAWQAGSSSSDPLIDQYSQSSFMLSQTLGAKFAFQFYGTSVSIIGSKRPNHGNFHAQLDQTTFPQVSGSATTDTFNQTLFSAKFDLGSHTVSLLNDGNTFIDIDYLSFDTTIGTSSEQLIVNTYQDSHPAFKYNPVNAWGTPDMPGSFSGSSGHSTSNPTASANFTFQVRSAVALYGPVGPNGVQLYAATIDKQPPTPFSAQKKFYRPQQLLFYAGGLGPGNHTLLIQPQGQGGGVLAIDYANVYTTPSLGGSFVSGSTSINQASHVPGGFIAGIVVSTIIALISTLALVIVIWRRRREELLPSGSNRYSGNMEAVNPFAAPGAQGYIQGDMNPISDRSLPPTTVQYGSYRSGAVVPPPPSSYQPSSDGYSTVSDGSSRAASSVTGIMPQRNNSQGYSGESEKQRYQRTLEYDSSSSISGPMDLYPSTIASSRRRTRSDSVAPPEYTRAVVTTSVPSE